MSSKKFFGGVALTALSIVSGGNAFAQSTGSEVFEETVVVTGQRTAPTVGGVMTNETTPKSRATVGQEYIQTQADGQTALEMINLIPGVNFTNNDSFGSSGGNIRMRSFDGNRISLTFDGMPLNDTGNYAIFSNQLLDSELLGQVQVNMGSTDVDSPTASAVGGTINYTLRKPSDDFNSAFSFGLGEEAFKRVFAGVDTGNLGWGMSALGALSFQSYDKWRGQGELQKRQVNGRLFKEIGDNGDFVSVAFHYNENRNNNYRQASMPEFEQFGLDFDFDATCVVPTPVAGTAQSQVSCTNFYGRQINPSNTGNIRGQSRFSLTDKLTLTVDPSFQYVLANGGGQFGTISETNAVVRGSVGATVAGRDLNGDGDTLDTVGFFTPSNTNTRRYGVTASLIWQVADDHRFRVAYTNDYGRHRQTGEYTFLNPDGTSASYFGGKDGWGPRVFNADGFHLRTRDRFSIALLNQIAAEYRGDFINDMVTVVVGVRAPFFKRDLNQFCYTQSNSSSVNCTSQTPVTSATAGFVQFDNNFDGDVVDSGETTLYVRPFQREQKYEAVLPNVGVSFRPFEDLQIFASYIEGLSAPRTDQLYNEDVLTVEPERTKAFDLGVRYSGDIFQASTAVFANKYSDRIQSAFDPDLGYSVDRSIGDVDVIGWEFGVGVTPIEKLDFFVSGTYLKSELQDDIRTGRGVDGVFNTADDPRLPTAGKQLTETPEWTASGRVNYEIFGLDLGLEAKWVDTRFTTDVNDEKTPAYTVVDFNVAYDLEDLMGVENTSIRFNVDNVFDEEYFGSISSGTNAFNIVSNGSTLSGSRRFVTPGAPRTARISLRKSF